MKSAEEGIGAGTILRLWNVSDEPQVATVQLAPESIAEATVVSHVEADESSHPVGVDGLTASFTQQQIRTFRVHHQPTEPAIPAVSTWALVIMAGLLLISGTVIAKARGRRPSTS